MSTSAEGERPVADVPESAHDSDAGLQEELRRETAERAALGGDTSMNRNLSGASTWITLGAAADGPTADQPDAPGGGSGPGVP